MERKARERLIKWTKDQLIGPTPYMDSKSEDEGSFLKGINPIERFPCGAIYPVFEGTGEDPAATEGDEGKDLDDQASADDGKESEPVRRYVPPSSIGLSFCLARSCACLEIYYSAARYEYKDNRWVRSPLDTYETFRPPTDNHKRDQIKIFNGYAVADVLWRKHGEEFIVTVSLCNNKKMTDDHYDSSTKFTTDRAKETLFEARIEVCVPRDEICVYPGVDKSLLDEEEQEIELQYREQIEYAIGHGTGVNWKIGEKDVKIKTDPIPTTEVPQITTSSDSSQEVLKFSYLAGALVNKDDRVEKLTEFVQNYEKWIEEQERTVSLFPDEKDKDVGARITGRMRKAKDRMRSGIKMLREDDAALRAFSLANRAILDQMVQVDKAKNEKSDYAWRPFQLAFLLTVLESATNNDSNYRDLVDLIWFPTGGGKTEAYLGLIAYVILLRRLKYPETYGGTTALMRYTLRLLTKDQYLRAARLICALELIRREQCDYLWDKPVSIGLWVGGDASPNSFSEAHRLVCDARNKGQKPSLVVDKCPWCGDKFSIPKGNYVSGPTNFYFLCTNKDCDFGRNEERLPCNIVDEDLYDNPPTLIIGTVDKFARMAWEERVGNFFGKRGNRPPELIIQDELHLISGALGSINGLYEAAIDSIIKLRGLHPKYIASTATIRTAEMQIRKLYGREATVFPPPGITYSNSYFAKTVSLSEKPGRQYIGYYAPMLNRQKCLAPLAATLLAAPIELFAEDVDKDRLMDAWWTGVVYHGSLKGLANSHMAFDSDVRERLKTVISEIKSSRKESGEHRTDVIKRMENRVIPVIEELTSHKTAAENAATFSRLAIGYDKNGYIDVALATNMVSVGLDVGRLALMVINGQPLTTAEYIQASSRVGRSDIPGVVFINYYRGQTRSLSHYEHFRAYHDAFYKYVEPTSVTPFTRQARNKALHAAIVSVIRHGIDSVNDADRFPEQPDDVDKALKVLKKRCAEADKELAGEVCGHIDSLAAEWTFAAKKFAEQKCGFKYYSNDGAWESLLYSADDKIQGLWKTLQSMRNVENTALLKEILPK